MTFWQTALLIGLGALIGFVLSAKLASRYYIGVGMAVILHGYIKAANDLEMMDQLNILADAMSADLHNEEQFGLIMDAARRDMKKAMFK